MSENIYKNQSIQIENRSLIKLTGVESVIGLSETDVGAIIYGDTLEIKGKNLKAEKLSIESGELTLSGEFYGMKFLQKKEKTPFLKKIFK